MEKLQHYTGHPEKFWPITLYSLRQIFKSLSRRLFFSLGVACFALFSAPVWGFINGKVYNETTGKFVPRVPVTLIEIGGASGMDPVAEVHTDLDGGFTFNRDLEAADGRTVHGMLRVEFEGVSYSQIVAGGVPSDDVLVTVYNIAENQELEPQIHGLLLEPRDGEIVVNEFFSFLNETDPPRTFRDSNRGTLRFHLTQEAKESLNVRVTGPARMPLRSSASNTGLRDVYSIDFPLKPGKNDVELTYRLPHNNEAYKGRLLYDGLATNLILPPGVTAESKGLRSLGVHPEIEASLFEIPAAREFEIFLSGQGRLRRSESPGAPNSPEIEVASAPIAQELIWVLAITSTILAIGFFRLLNSRVLSTSSSKNQ